MTAIVATRKRGDTEWGAAVEAAETAKNTNRRRTKHSEIGVNNSLLIAIKHAFMYGIFVAVSVHKEYSDGQVSRIGYIKSGEKKEHIHKCSVYGAEDNIQKRLYTNLRARVMNMWV